MAECSEKQTRWTPQQQRAIDLREKNILVSAAAGSGKTAVLVERIKKLILEDNVPIDRMLIVTFTKAAASEMTEKIRKTIVAEIDANPENGELLRRQLALLSKANISTFHSFALDVLRRFFHMSDITPGFKICDDAQSTILKEEAMDSLLEEFFENLSPEFCRLLDWYSSERNYNRIREQIHSAYTALQAMPYPWKWLDEAVSAIGTDMDEFKKTNAWKFLTSYVDEQARMAVFSCEEACNTLIESGLDRLAEKISECDYVFYQELRDAIDSEDIDKARMLVNNFKAAVLRPNKEEKEDYEEIKGLVSGYRDQSKNAVKKIAELYLGGNFSDMLDEINQTGQVAEEFQKLLLRFDELFTEGKKKKHLIDFNDIEHYCLEILENEPACSYYKEKFEYIFIDEYQDTNVLQEEIISRIKRDNNLFMVGDIKQSIYKFRLAEPEIFKHKYEEYAKEGENPEGKSEKIDLNKNFRSTPVILDEINHVFKEIMDGYDAAAMLYAGREERPENKRPNMRIVNVEASKEDDELSEMKNTEIEALEAANIVKNIVGKTFYDHKKGVERPIRYSDIVILMRGIKNTAGVFSQMLKSQGIDSYVDENEGYFDTIEISVFMNLLSVIDNKKQDVELISVLRSEIFDFTSQELATVRTIDKKCSFEEAFVKYAAQGEAPLSDKCRAALNSIESFRELSRSMALSKFIWKLMLETDYYIRCGAMPAGRQRQANLRALVEKAENYESMGQGSLFSFVRYIDAIKKRKVPMGQVKLLGEGDDLIRIMTIHKSKGLEFPVVIVSGMGKKCNYSKSTVGVSLHKDIGIGFTLVNHKEHWYKQTLMQKLINLKVREEEVAEEKRILYVAMTRAKDYLYMTGTVRNKKAYEKIMEKPMPGEESYLSMSMHAREILYIEAATHEASAQEPVRFYGNPMDWNIYGTDGNSAQLSEEAVKRLSYTYPYADAAGRKSKYSVSELFHDERTSSVKMMKMPNFGAGKRRISAAEKGNVYHTIMEHIDFVKAGKCSVDFVEETCRELVEKQILTEEEVQAVKLQNIVKFFHSPLGITCAEKAAAGNLEREKPFTMEITAAGCNASGHSAAGIEVLGHSATGSSASCNASENPDDEKILVQGIIDCYYEDEDGFVIVDYKSNRIDPELPPEQEKNRITEIYRGQLDLYSKALENASGKPVKERYLFLLSIGESIRI